jgi:hypothetical protein
VVEELIGLQCLGQVNNGLLLIVDQIGVVRDPFFGDGPQALEEIGSPVVYTDPVDIGFDFNGWHC